MGTFQITKMSSQEEDEVQSFPPSPLGMIIFWKSSLAQLGTKSFFAERSTAITDKKGFQQLPSRKRYDSDTRAFLNHQFIYFCHLERIIKQQNSFLLQRRLASYGRRSKDRQDLYCTTLL